MAMQTAGQLSVNEWFKTNFSEEARATAKTARLADGQLSFNFSATNTSGIDFNNFSFNIKVLDRDRGSVLGSATINAGAWKRGERKNFKSKLMIPDNVRNISFVMEAADYNVANSAAMSSPMQDLTDAAKDMGRALGKAGEGMGGMLGELFSNGGMPGAGETTVTKTTTTERSADGRTTTRTVTTTKSSGGGAARQTASPQQSTVQQRQAAGTAGTYAQRKNEKKLNKKRLGKSGWIIATLVMGILFGLAAISSLVAGDIAGLIQGGAFAAVLLGASGYLKYSLGTKAKRIRTYEANINMEGNTSIDDLAAAVGRPFEKVADDLHQMKIEGFFPECEVDIDNRLLVMTKNGQPIEDISRSVAMNKKAKRKSSKDGSAAPESLDDLIAMTDDSDIKTKLKALRTITKKIDARVEEVPELEKQVTDYREKYYPEVVRLTDEYNEKIVNMGKYGEENTKAEVTESADGAPVINSNPNYLQEQADEIKSQLVSLIDSVTEASENLLEKLHEEDIMDITTDIKMLQTTLASKGLLDSDFDIKE